MEEIDIDGCLAKGNEQWREGSRIFVSRLYKEDFSWRSKLDCLDFTSLDDQHRGSLKRKFFEKEVIGGLMHCRMDIASKPDSF